ncbi:MAG: hypothetical protein WC891_05280 [Actinomycetota bacterium]
MGDEDLIWGTSEELEGAIENLKHNHPGWSQHIFLLYALYVFRELDYAWRQGHLDNLTDDMTTSCLEALKKAPPPPNIPLDVQGLQLAAIGEEGEYDTIDVRYMGNRRQGGEGPGETITYLKFIRYRFEHATDAATGMAETCPRCGGRIDPTADWICHYCDQKVNEQSSGWLVQKVMDQGNYVP